MHQSPTTNASIKDLASGDWFKWDHGFAMLMRKKSEFAQILTYSDTGTFHELQSVRLCCRVEFITSFAARVPWKRQ